MSFEPEEYEKVVWFDDDGNPKTKSNGDIEFEENGLRKGYETNDGETKITDSSSSSDKQDSSKSTTSSDKQDNSNSSTKDKQDNSDS